MDKMASGPMVSARDPEKDFRSISQAYADIEFTLQQIEQPVTYYQLLGLTRKATKEQVVSAHQAIFERLNPAYYHLEDPMPDTIASRMERALLRLRKAYEVLSDSDSRLKYDSLSRDSAVLPTALPGGISAAKPPNMLQAFDAAFAGAPKSMADAPRAIRSVRGQQPTYTKARTEKTGADRRRLPRAVLSIPVKVVGHSKNDGKWQEIAQTTSLDRFGVGLVLSHRVRRGIVLHLTMQMPTKFRNHAYHEPFYCVYGIVRRVDPRKTGERVVGLEFVGASPPPGYLEQPWAHLRLDTWSGPDRRKRNRMPQIEEVQIEFLDGSMKVVARQTCRTEDLSPDGAKVCLTGLPVDVDYVRLTCKRIDFKSKAVIRDMYKGKDGLARICIEFIEE